MPAPTTANQFLELASKSGLLDPHHLQGYLQGRRAAGGLPDAPRPLADTLVGDGLLTRFQAEQLLGGRWQKFILNGKYKILGPLGAGGMGCVYLCEHQVMRRRVAVKVLPVRRAEDPAALERFRREARAVAQLKHPNIVGAHDIDFDGRLHFLVMEYVDGSTLQAVAKSRGPLDPLRAAHYVCQAALGLQHAHEAGLVHRDVKPSNLLLDRAGTVKVLDLGLARFFHDEADDLSRQHLEGPLGTTDYMAPEQALDSHHADIRADIYSLGATFYYLLTGHGPYKEGTPIEKLVRRHVQPPQPIREIRPEVPEGLAAVLTRMMAKEPADRYQTPAEVAAALAPWTQAPIAPPPREDMPELIRPVSGGDAGPVSGLPASLYGPASGPTPSPARQGDTAVSSSARATVRPQNTVVGQQPKSAPCTVVRPEVKPPASPAPSPPAVKPSAPPQPRPPWPEGRRRQTMLAGGAVFVLAVIIAGFTLLRRTPTNEQPAPTPPLPAAPGLASAPAPVAVTGGATPMKLLVPAYFYPGGDGQREWDRLINSPAATATVAIVNPASGAGETEDPNYARVLERARQKGVTVIGYVSTKYGDRPLSDVKAEVDRWVRFYPRIQGIFFDEQASAADRVPYYAALYEYVRKERGLALVVNNPGTLCAEEYVARPAADVVCLGELVKDFGAYRRPAWADRYPPERFSAYLSAADSEAQMQRAIAAMRSQRIGHCYVTDGQLPNPWARLPPYWEAEVEAARPANARSASPASR